MEDIELEKAQKMGKIHLLKNDVIDKIAAGESVERPASVAKELIENAVDAGADAVTVEIRDGGITYLRVTDNGSGIAPDDVRTAFLRHATSKIESEKDLERIGSLGFRGEALASVAAVSRVELITKRPEDLTGTRYVIEGGIEKGITEVGAPDGTTIIVRDLFYNTPARQKFLKTAVTEGAHIASFMEQLALSNPDVGFSFLSSGQLKMQTSGNGSVRDVIYRVYGRTIVRELLEVDAPGDGIRVSGWIAKPSVSRSTRSYENYYVNGRYVKSSVIAKAIEDGYGNKLMQHSYPFTCLMVDVSADAVDVNVHPQKMEVRFSEEKRIYEAVKGAVSETVSKSEMIVPAVIGKPESTVIPASQRKEEGKASPEPFEQRYRDSKTNTPGLSGKPSVDGGTSLGTSGSYGSASGKTSFLYGMETGKTAAPSPVREDPGVYGAPSFPAQQVKTEQLSFLSPEAVRKRKIVGQIFSTYWIVEFGDEVLFIDQHAAHEKILYEKLMKQYKDSEILSQPLLIPEVISANARERLVLSECKDAFAALGFEIEPFGDTEYKISSVPYNLSGADIKQLFREILKDAGEFRSGLGLPSYVHEIATEACKAAVKGGGEISFAEAESMLEDLMKCDDPYHCPHGRPTIISMSRREFEKKFKRIL